MGSEFNLIRSSHKATGRLFIAVLLLSVTGVTAQQQSATDVLQSIRSARAKLENYQCSVEYMTFTSYETRKRRLDWSPELGQVSGDTLERLRQDLDGTGKTFEIQNVVADSTGRIKTTHTRGRYHEDDSKEFTTYLALAWDGTMGVSYTQLHPNGDGPGGAMIKPTRDDHFRIARRPLWTFSDRFVDALDKAIETGRAIDIRQETSAGLLKITFLCDDPVSGAPNRTWSGTIDPSKGFSIVRWDFTEADGARYGHSAVYEEVEEGIWFPVKGQTRGHFADGILQGNSSMTVTELVVNDPNFSDTLFHVEIPNGTIVRDTISGITFIAGDPSSLRITGSAMNAGEIVNEAMKPEEAGRNRAIFLPHIRRASEANSPFVLDLGTSTLIGVDKADGVQDTLTRLRGGGMGDIFWSDGVVAVEGIEIVPTDDKPRGLLTFVEMDHGGIYKFTAPPPLPCVLSITGRNERRYRVTIQSIGEDGISLSYERRATEP